MAIKLIMEDEAPNRAILLMDQGDILECKASGMTLHYEKDNGKPHTFEGYLKIGKIPVEVTELSIDNMMKEFSFNNTVHAVEVLGKLESILPELKVTGDRAIDSITNDNESSTDKDKAVISTRLKQDDIEKNKDKSQEGEKKSKLDKTKIKLKDLKNLPAAFRKKSKESTNNKEEGKPTEQSDKSVWPGCIKVGTIGYFKAGFVLAHVYKNNDGEDEVVILNVPVTKEFKESLPVLFAKEKQAEYFYKGLINHPRWADTVKLFQVIQLKQFDMKTVNSSALLVRDPKTLLNAMAKRSQGNGK